jgi:glutamate synthase domain-containing protein 2
MLSPLFEGARELLFDGIWNSHGGRIFAGVWVSLQRLETERHLNGSAHLSGHERVDALMKTGSLRVYERAALSKLEAALLRGSQVAACEIAKALRRRTWAKNALRTLSMFGGDEKLVPIMTSALEALIVLGKLILDAASFEAVSAAASAAIASAAKIFRG